MNQHFGLKTGFSVCLILLCLAACARLPTAPVGERPVVQSPADLLQQLQQRAGEINSLAAKGNVSVMAPQKNFTGNVVLTLNKPSDLKVEILNFWGQPAVAFLTRDREMKLLIYPESKVYRGPATAENLRRFIPLPVSIPDFLAMLTGRIAFDQYDQPTFPEPPGAGFYTLELTSRQEAQRVRLKVDSQNLDLLSAQWLDLQGLELMTAQFSDVTAVGPISAPREIQAATGDKSSQVRIRYRDLTFNIPGAASAMDLPVSGAIRELSFPR